MLTLVRDRGGFVSLPKLLLQDGLWALPDLILDVGKNKSKRVSIVQKAGGIRILTGRIVVETVNVRVYGCVFRSFCLVLKESRAV